MFLSRTMEEEALRRGGRRKTITAAMTVVAPFTPLPTSSSFFVDVIGREKKLRQPKKKTRGAFFEKKRYIFFLPLLAQTFSFFLYVSRPITQLDASAVMTSSSAQHQQQHQQAPSAPSAPAPAPPSPPPPPPAWRVRLNHGPLRAALHDAKLRVGERCHAPFKTRVSKAAVPDYGRYVAPAQEMWLDKVKAKIERCDYESCARMRRDVAVIAAAAAAYNDAESGGACRSPALVAQARELAEAVERALRERAAEIEEAEASGERVLSFLLFTSRAFQSVFFYFLFFFFFLLAQSHSSF